MKTKELYDMMQPEDLVSKIYLSVTEEVLRKAMSQILGRAANDNDFHDFRRVTKPGELDFTLQYKGITMGVVTYSKPIDNPHEIKVTFNPL